MKKLIITNFILTCLDLLFLILTLWLIEEYNETFDTTIDALATFSTMLLMITLIPIGIINVALFIIAIRKKQAITE